MPSVQHPRGTRAALDTLAGSSGLLVGQIYVLTDENRLAVATSTSAYETFAKESEAGGGGDPGRVLLMEPIEITSAVSAVNITGIDWTGLSKVILEFVALGSVKSGSSTEYLNMKVSGDNGATFEDAGYRSVTIPLQGNTVGTLSTFHWLATHENDSADTNIIISGEVHIAGNFGYSTGLMRHLEAASSNNLREKTYITYCNYPVTKPNAFQVYQSIDLDQGAILVWGVK